MRVDTNRFLNVYDLEDLSRAYTNAYLRKNGVSIEDDEPHIDREFNLGQLDEGYVLKAADQSLFILCTAPAIQDNEETINSQILSHAVHDRFVDAIAFLIANNYQRLPASNINLGFCLNHDDTHWTLLMSRFQGLTHLEYGALYKAYQRYRKTHAVSKVIDETTTASQALQNHVKNFLINHKQITRMSRTNDKIIPGNLRLPLSVKSIHLTHYDSYGDDYDHTVKATLKNMIKKHRAKFSSPSIEEQDGCTCGDWSIFNAMRFGLLNKKNDLSHASHQFSYTLRNLQQNLTMRNANAVLYKKKPLLTKAKAEDKICVTHEGRRLMNLWEEEEARAQLEKRRKKTRARLRKNKADINVRRFNNTYPFLNLLTQIVLGIGVASALFWTLSVFFTLNVGAALFLALVGCIVSSCYLYDKTSTYLFGKEKIRLNLNDEGKPYIEQLEEKEGLVYTLLGVKAPFHTTLSSLENEIQALLTPADSPPLSSDQRRLQMKENHLLTRFYAQKIIRANPNLFYHSDKAVASQKGYINLKKARKVIANKA